jgi:hypothetical protein
MVWLVVSGPLAQDAFRWSSFTHAQPFLNFMQKREKAESVPTFYRELPPGDEPILEAPWMNIGTQSFSAYQRVHRHPLRMATLNRHHVDPRVQFRNILPPFADSLIESDVRWVVVHVDVREEELGIETPELQHIERLEQLPELWETLRGAGLRRRRHPGLGSHPGARLDADDGRKAQRGVVASSSRVVISASRMN